MLSVSLGSVVGSAKHLAVAFCSSSIFAPSLHVVGFHLRQSPYLVLVGIMPDSTQRTVANMILTCLCRLAAVHSPLSVLIKHAHIQKPCIL